MTHWVTPLAKLSDDRRDFVLVSLVGIRGSAPQVVGSKMIVTKEGLLWGTVGGGKIEAHCIQYARGLLASSRSSCLETWNLQKDIGMSCGGEVSVFFDRTQFSTWNVAIFGAGHVAQELCRVMQTWSCRVQVFDTRSEWLEKLPKSFNIEGHLTTDLSQHVHQLRSGTYLLCMTPGHATDMPVLEEALRIHENFSFLGVIGSRVKGEKIRAELRGRGISDTAIERLICPLGLAIGNNTPPEISISIAAQILGRRTEIDATEPQEAL